MKVNGKIKKISLIVIIIAFLVISFGIGFSIFSPKSNTNNEYIDDVKEYSDNISIDNIKGDKNKALYLVLSESHKTSDEFAFLKKDGSKYLFRERNTNVCYEADLNDFIVVTISNCNYEVNK